MSEQTCPTCSKSLATEQGMRQHHTKVHGIPLPNRTCGECDEMFYDPKARRVYCDDCYTGAGEQNGNWQNAAETTDCRRCDTEFEYYPSNKDGVFCSDCVERMNEFIGTPSHEGKVTEKVTTPCEQCGAAITVRKSKRNYGSGRFCSRPCLAEWQSENWRGEGHPAWDGGWNDERIRNWTKVKRQTLERDNHRCQNCEASVEDLGQEPDIHHIVPLREFDDPTRAHTLDNLIALCRACHMRIEHGLEQLPERNQ